MCLDVAGLAANLYRRNTPIIKVCSQLLLWQLAVFRLLSGLGVCLPFARNWLAWLSSCWPG